MDKVKAALAVLKKHHFWVLCALIVLISMTVWTMAVADLKDRFTTRSGELNSSFSSVQAIYNEPDFPNQQVIDATEAATVDLSGIVFRAWNMLYDEQKQKNELPDSLSQSVKNAFAEFERSGKEFPIWDRDTYSSFIGKHFDTLFKDLDVVRPAEEDATGAGPAGTGGQGNLPSPPGQPGGRTTAGAATIGVVEWDKTKRGLLTKRFTSWPTRPTTKEVVEAQEDLWVYEALLRIIKNTNQGATTPDNAAISKIEALEIGARAVNPMEAGRYVNAEGALLGDGDKPPFAEFKIMPIKMQLEMDQRKISTLLAECANSTMPIEVRKVTLNPGKGGSLAALNTGAEAGGTLAGASQGTVWTVASETEESQAGVVKISVEVLGVIYIYNPPDLDKLGTGAAGEQPDAAAPDAAPGEAPPDAAAPDATPAPPGGPAAPPANEG